MRLAYGHLTKYGYLGKVDGRWMQFCSEDEYVEYLKGE